MLSCVLTLRNSILLNTCFNFESPKTKTKLFNEVIIISNQNKGKYCRASFGVQELNYVLKTANQDPRNILQVSQSSILDP